jgi:hypothetical protein
VLVLSHPGCERVRTPVCLDSSAQITHLAQEAHQVVVCRGEVGLQRERATQGFERTREITAVLPQATESAMG